MIATFKLRHAEPTDTSQPGKLDAFFSQTDSKNQNIDVDTLARYVKITSGKSSAVLRPSIKKTNGIIKVAKGALKKVKKDTEVDYKNATAREFYWYKFFHDGSTQLALLGLVLAIAGTLIDKSLAWGKDGWHYWEFEKETLHYFAIASGTFQIAGFFLVFWKGFSESK